MSVDIVEKYFEKILFLKLLKQNNFLYQCYKQFKLL